VPCLDSAGAIIIKHLSNQEVVDKASQFIWIEFENAFLINVDSWLFVKGSKRVTELDILAIDLKNIQSNVRVQSVSLDFSSWGSLNNPSSLESVFDNLLNVWIEPGLNSDITRGRASQGRQSDPSDKVLSTEI
jgi:hypothetical protein